MDAVQKVKEICKARKIPISRLEKELGFGNAYISQLRKGVFPYDRAVAISNYLDIPLHFLLTGEEEQKENPGIPKDTEVDPIRAELLNLIEDATAAERKYYLDILRVAVSRHEKR